MKTTENFKKTIKAYLDKRAAEDELFAVTYAKPEKNIDDCINYILNQVQKSGCCGFTDDEIYSIAVHYYDEDISKDDCKHIDCEVIVNHQVQLTEEEKAELRSQAKNKYEAEVIAQMKREDAELRRKAQERKQKNQSMQQSLF